MDVLNGTNDIDGSVLNNVSPAWDVAATDDVKLQKIWTQKYLAIFPEGIEAWSEVRRTGYPKLFPVVINNSQGVIPDGEFVNRLNFSITDRDANTEGYNDAVSKLKGPDDQYTKLWWDVN